MEFPEKLVLIGVDGAIPDIVKKLMREGKLPNMTKVMDKGFFSQILAPFPTVTPNNWTSLATGAWAGTTSITDYHIHHVGEPLDIIYSGFNTSECSAEYLWDAAERSGKKVLLMKYSASWPPTIKNGIQVDGCGPNPTDEVHEICGENLFTTVKGYPLAKQIEFKPSYSNDDVVLTSQLKFAPHPKLRIFDGRRLGLVARIPTVSVLDMTRYEPVIFSVLLTRINEVYKKVIISKSTKIEDEVAKLGVGEWSTWVKLTFSSKEDRIEGSTRFKLIELSEDGERFRLYSTQVMPSEGWTKPAGIAAELSSKFGSFVQRPGWEGIIRGWIDDETFLDLVDYQNRWMAEASVYLMKKYGYDLFFLQTHGPDYAHHVYMNKIDPLTNPDDESRRHFFDYLTRVYQSVDQLVGTIFEAIDEKTMVVIVSDHGAQPHIGDVNVYKILAEGGLLTFKKDDTGMQVVDWNRTKAIPQRQCYIYVNLKRRDPNGIVEPGEEYEKVRDEVIELLQDYRDEKNGKNPFCLILKKEDARILGLHGEGIGDIIYALSSGFGHEHGQQLSTARFGLFGSLGSMVIGAGPGIRKGAELKPTRWLIDLAPTIAYLLDMPTPRNTDGSVMYEILEDPDGRFKEKEALKREMDNWRNANEKMRGLIHI